MAGDDPLNADFYVAPDGNDHWSGRLPEPNAKKTDGPFATLTRARDAVRDLKKDQSTRDIVVLIREGLYYLNETVVFGLEDSGEGAHSVTYAAYPDEKPVFSSAIPIKGWKKLDSYPSSLPEVARGRVWVADLPKTSEGTWRFFTLYDADGKLPRARSSAFSPIMESESTRKERSKQSKDILHFPPGALKKWENLEDVEIFIRPNHLWIVNYLPLASVDEEAHVARTALLGTYPLKRLHFDKTKHETCWVENVLEAHDQPGEWALNTREGKVYLWPRNLISEQQIMAPMLRELIRVEGKIDFDGPVDVPVRNLCFKGLTFMHGDRDLWTKDDAGVQHDWEMYDKNNALVRLRGAENCVIESCHFTHSGGTAIRVDLYGQQNRILNNHIEHMGGTGILVCGYGPGTKDVSKQNEVLNNYIHHCGELYWHSPGILIWQSGENRVANNLIHGMPYAGIIVSGGGAGTKFYETADQREISRTVRWHEVGEPGPRTHEQIAPFIHTRSNIIEYNEIHHVMEKLGDGNGIYIRMSGAGNIIRRNYIHHLVGPTSGQSALRTDGQQRDTLITENVIYKCVASGIVLKCNNRAENNIIMNILETDDPENVNRIPPREYFRLKEGPMTGAALKRNILYHHGKDVVFYNESERRRGYGPALAKDADTDYNIYYCADNPELGLEHLKKMQGDGVDSHSLAVDPLFVDPENGDFRLKPESPASGLGFKQIDVSEIGLKSE